MEKKHSHHWRRWMIPTLLVISAAGVNGLCQIAPTGRNAGVIQFDAINELNNNAILDGGLYHANTVWFARYWVCRDYYAVSVVWTEPRGWGLSNVKTLAILSDRNEFRISEDQFPLWVPANTTYPKPLGERGPFAWGGGFYGVMDVRFADAEALSRRVYAGDLESLKTAGGSAESTIAVKPGNNPDGVKRKSAQLKVQARAGRIEAMDVLDNASRKLVGIKYEYDRGNNPQISRLVADLPVRPEKLPIDGNTTVTMGDTKIPYRITDIDHVYHKGGRTCAVTYRDVKAGSATIRLPVQVEVRRSDDKQLVRSAKLMNFKRVDLDKAAVWEAAKTYGGFSGEDKKVKEITDKFLNHNPDLGPLKVDPNDLALVRRLIARYPTPELVPMVEPGMDVQVREKQLAEWRERRKNTPKPRRMDVEPNDARLIRQWLRYHAKTSIAAEEEREKMRKEEPTDMVSDTPSVSKLKLDRLRLELGQVLSYHRLPVLPEDKTPEPNDLDLQLIRRLRSHYEPLFALQNRTLGERLKVLDALCRLDLVARNYDAFEQRTVLYLQTLHDANLPAMYLVGGYDDHINRLIKAGQLDRAKKLVRLWMDGSVTGNNSDAIYRFCSSDKGGKGDPWVAVQLLDRFLKKPGLSPLERYEALSLRAIALDAVDKLLAIPQDDLNAKGGKIGQVQWILSGTTKTEIAKRVDSALREAVSAWQSLGAAKDKEAKPYSTAGMATDVRERLGYSADATRLQETSARLNKIVQQRSGQKGSPSRSAGVTPRSGGTRRSGTTR